MIQFGPDTRAECGGAGYVRGDTKIFSFSLTHLDGVGCTAASDLPFTPTVGELAVSPIRNRQAYASDFTNDVATPGYYRAKLAGDAMQAELAATTRSGIAQFKFPASAKAAVILNPTICAKGVFDSQITLDPKGRQITGWAKSGGFVGAHRYIIYFCARFDHPFSGYGTWDGPQKNATSTTIRGTNGAAYVQFDTTKDRTVAMKVAISFVSAAGAAANLDAEIPGWDLAPVREATSRAWDDLLGHIQVTGGKDAQKKLFYTSIYHACLQPGIFEDVDGKYIGFDDQIYSVKSAHHQYATFSLWDTYRSQPQLLALIAPQVASDMAQSLLQDVQQTYKNGGGFQSWGYYNDDTACMGTYPAPIFIANAYAFGATNFDTVAMKAKLIECATSTNPIKTASSPDVGGQGWWGLQEYIRDGYANSASETLEYSQTDMAIAQFCRTQGDEVNGRLFLKRAQNVFNLFDPKATKSAGYLRPKDRKGQWMTPFSPTSTQGFTEGCSAQYTWGTPQNIARLIRLMGGESNFVARLDHHLSKYASGGWDNLTGSEYWWSGNEPGMGVPFLYNWARQPWKTQFRVRHALDHSWSATPDGLPGNDDTGTMSAWYVFCAMGLYPEIPGVGGFAVFTPIFDTICLELPNQKVVNIHAPGTSTKTPYIQSMELNGKPSSRCWIDMNTLTAGSGAQIEFKVGPAPSQWGGGEADVPPSFD